MLATIVFFALLTSFLFVWQLAAPKGTGAHKLRAALVNVSNLILAVIFTYLAASGKIAWTKLLVYHAIFGYGFALSFFATTVAGTLHYHKNIGRGWHRLLADLSAILFILNIVSGLYSFFTRFAPKYFH